MSDCCKAKNGPLKVQQLQRTLYCKFKQEVQYKFYSLYDKICHTDVLWEAWKQVKANKGAAGIDGRSVEEVEAQGVGLLISKLQEQLNQYSYQFSPVKCVEIAKPKGGTRLLGISTIADRIVQTAMKLIIEPIFEADFHDCSYGYRPKRNAKQASVALRSALYCQAWGVVEIDFKSYFTSIPHDKLLALIIKRITDGNMLKLIKQTLKVSTVQNGQFSVTKMGVAQGSPLSPLYSNIYLNVLDQMWHKMGYPEKLGATLHRYCDDVVLVCRRDALKVLETFKKHASELELTMNVEKTQITKLTKGFDFIGYHFVKRRSSHVEKNIIYIFPTKRARQAIRHKIKRVTSRRAPIKPKEFVKLIHERVLGWVNYYRHTNASISFRQLQHFINNRFRRYLTQRSKGRGFGWRQYPSEKLYALGLIYIHSGIVKY